MLDTAALIESLLKDSGGVEVTFGTSTTWGHQDVVDEVVMGDGGRGEVIATRRVLVIAAGILSDLYEGSEILIGDVIYVTGAPQRIEDGALLRIPLEDY